MIIIIITTTITITITITINIIFSSLYYVLDLLSRLPAPLLYGQFS